MDQLDRSLTTRAVGLDLSSEIWESLKAQEFFKISSVLHQEDEEREPAALEGLVVGVELLVLLAVREETAHVGGLGPGPRQLLQACGAEGLGQGEQGGGGGGQGEQGAGEQQQEQLHDGGDGWNGCSRAASSFQNFR